MVTDASGVEVSADIDKDASFELEMEQPLLTTDRVPVPYSTSISFPASDTNKRLFGWLPTMMLEPSRRKIPCRIVLGDYELASGVLVYSGVNDGKLQYSFSGKGLDEIWDRKIWNITDKLNDEIDEETGGLGIAGYSFGYRWMCFPILVSASATTEVYVGLNGGTIQDPGIKYRNYRGSGDVATHSSPAVYASVIIGQAADNVSMGEDFERLLNAIAVLGIYKNTETWGGSGDSSDYATGREWFRMLPDVTILNLTREIMKLCGAVMFRDTMGYRILSFREVYSEENVLDWSDKVSSIYDSEVQQGQKYRLKYNNTEGSAEKTVGTFGFSGIIDAFLDYTPPPVWDPMNGYSNQAHCVTGDNYSGKKYAGMTGMIECDCTSHYIGSVGCNEDEDDDREAFDQSVGLELVKCIPETVYNYLGVGGIERMVSPVITFADPKSERGTSVKIGLAIPSLKQMCDKGIVIDGSRDYNSGINLSIDSLYDRYHQEFATWVGKDRQVVSAELDISIAELSSFRLWQKVRFSNRNWIVKKLTIDFHASGRMVVRGCFISM